MLFTILPSVDRGGSTSAWERFRSKMSAVFNDVRKQVSSGSKVMT
jgi:hypothetical protein